MKKVILAWATFLAFLLMLICTAPLALAAIDEMQQSTSGMKYMTGGIGQDEADDMRRIAKQFSLNILFSEGAVGRYATGVNVIVYDAHGKVVFNLDDANPLLYIDLPVGEYKVEASYNGLKQSYVININRDANRKLILNWHGPVEEDDTKGTE